MAIQLQLRAPKELKTSSAAHALAHPCALQGHSHTHACTGAQLLINLHTPVHCRAIPPTHACTGAQLLLQLHTPVHCRTIPTTHVCAGAQLLVHLHIPVHCRTIPITHACAEETAQWGNAVFTNLSLDPRFPCYKNWI